MLLLCAGAPARAGDLPIKAPPQPAPSAYNWSGFYLGGSVGAAWGSLDPATSTPLTGAYFPDAAVVTAVDDAGTQGKTLSSVPVGLEAGYNWQAAGSPWLLGIEADIQSLRLGAGVQTGPAIYPGFAPATFSIGSAVSANWLTTVRPRFGWAADTWLFYVTGGLAVTRLDGEFGFADSFGSVESGYFSTLRAGYAAGAGVEVGLDDRWSVKAEYLFAGIPTTSTTSGNLINLTTPVAGQPFVHSADLKINIARVGLNYRFGEAAALSAGAVGSWLPLKAPVLKAPPAAWSWAGFYLGAHAGVGLGTTTFADPFGPTVFGGAVRSPTAFGGGQLGYNWQAPQSPWVYGIEADVSAMSGDGTVTCYTGGSAQNINATCESRPRLSGTLTGRVGYAFGDFGRTLIYGKAGLAAAGDRIDIAQNFGDLVAYTSFDTQAPTFWGGIAGFGVERALTPAWSLSLEYDYLGFASRNIANVGSVTCMPVVNGCVVTAVAPPGLSGATLDLQELKAGLNYHWGTDPAAHWAGDRPWFDSAAPEAGWRGFEVEGGGRYFGSWGQFHKDIGFGIPSGLPSISSISRLTYDDLQTNSGETFARIDTPWNVFVKGFIGDGVSNGGHLNDEDFLITLGGGLFPYSNTLSAAADGSIGYGAIDGGVDLLRGSGYKVGAYAGYFQFHQFMSAYGCTPLAGINCIPPIPVSGDAPITENDTWRALRVGAAGEAMLADRIKLGADIAYLPYLTLHGVDQHFFANSGVLANDNQETGTGQGAQAETVLSYYLTPQFSVGIGARYWGLWTTSAQIVRDYDASGLPTPTPPQYFKAAAEQAGGFVQASYKFGD